MNNRSISRDEWHLFTRMSSAGHVDRQPQENDNQKPHWVSRQVWDSLDELEALVIFNGLKESITEHSEQWREHFNVSYLLLLKPGLHVRRKHKHKKMERLTFSFACAYAPSLRRTRNPGYKTQTQAHFKHNSSSSAMLDSNVAAVAR